MIKKRRSQVEKFRQAARDLEDEKRFNEKLGKLASKSLPRLKTKSNEGSIQLMGPASAGCGSARLLNYRVQQITESRKILDGSHNAGSYDALHIDDVLIDEHVGPGPCVGKGEGYQWAWARSYIETPNAESFLDVVRVYCRRLLALIGQDESPGSKSYDTISWVLGSA